MKSADGSSSTSSRRPYDSSRRRAQAEERQRRVLEAATELFLTQGYGATSIDQIARAADVSPQSVYATFESKAGILEGAVHLARAGDRAGRGRDLPEAAAIVETTDLRERCRATAAFMRRMYEDSAALIALVERASAVDPQLADLHDRFREQRRASVEAMTANVPTKAFRKAVARKDALDAMTFFSGANTYTELVEGMGWTPDRYERWLADALYQLLFAKD
jgi:AcrR family transcriptional regulator